MALLHIYDSSDSRIVQTVGARGGSATRLPIPDGNNLQPSLAGLVAAGSRFERILFETHGSSGRISFGGRYIDAAWWRAMTGQNFTSLTTADARVYFNGCNVAEGAAGWEFLEAAAGILLNPGGGVVFGQTSVGFGNPFNGHVVHLWGSTRTVFVASDGRIVERFEQ